MNKVIVAGSINMDVVATVARHPLPGETLTGNTLLYVPGGKGANQAVAAAKLGADTFLIGKLGADSFAKQLESFLKEQHVRLDHVRQVLDTPSGTALIVVAASGENTIVVIPGSNAKVSSFDIENVIASRGDVFVSQFEIPIETISSFFKKGRTAGCITILNAAPATKCGDDILSLADVLIVNETELAFLNGGGVLDPTDRSHLISIARSIRKDKTQTVIVTLGENGALAVRQNEVFSAQGRRVDVVDTTGAGDCFTGALAARLAAGESLHAALQFANIAASICVQRFGAGPSMPMAEEIEMLLEANDEIKLNLSQV